MKKSTRPKNITRDKIWTYSIPFNIRQIFCYSNDWSEHGHEPSDESDLGWPLEGRPNGIFDSIVYPEIQQEAPNCGNSQTGQHWILFRSNRGDRIDSSEKESRAIQTEQELRKELVAAGTRASNKWAEEETSNVNCIETVWDHLHQDWTCNTRK